MANEAARPAEQPAPNISADFLTGSTEIGLDRIRTRLLDLTNRNKLLNFRHTTASSLRVVGVPIDQVFRRLRDNEKLSFLPVPEPDIETDGPRAPKTMLSNSDGTVLRSRRISVRIEPTDLCRCCISRATRHTEPQDRERREDRNRGIRHQHALPRIRISWSGTSPTTPNSPILLLWSSCQ